MCDQQSVRSGSYMYMALYHSQMRRHVLTLHLLRKKCIRKCRLLKSPIVCKCLHQGLISAYILTVWTQINLHVEEQSDLGPYYLLQRRFKRVSRRHTSDEIKSRLEAEDRSYDNLQVVFGLPYNAIVVIKTHEIEHIVFWVR